MVTGLLLLRILHFVDRHKATTDVLSGLYELLKTSSADKALVEEQDLVYIQPNTLTLCVSVFCAHLPNSCHEFQGDQCVYIKRRHEAKAGFFNKKLLL